MRSSSNAWGAMGPTAPVQLAKEEGVEEVASGEVQLLVAHHHVPALHHNRSHIAAESTKCISLSQCQVALVSTRDMLNRTRQQRLTQASTRPAVATHQDTIALRFNKASTEPSQIVTGQGRKHD